MSIQLPTTKEQFNTFLANLEGQVGQSAPINDKAFLRVLAGAEAGMYTSIYKWAANEILNCLAITANREGLINIGNNYGIPINPSEPAQYTITLPALTGTVIPITVDFVGDANGVRYSIDSPVIASAGIATINVTAKAQGVQGNLIVGDTMSISTQIPGAETQATITIIDNIGVDSEETEDYRVRVLDKTRATPGGGNSADYRIWSQEVAGVRRAYPYSGKPITSSLPSAPPDRTVYIESTVAIDPDGIPPSSLLDDVRESITTDPETGISRQPLGLTDDTLYVEPIIRTAFYISISDLVIDSSVESQAKTKFSESAELYLRNRAPYVDGLDASFNNRSVITDPSVSQIAHNVFSSFGGSVGSVAFDVTPGTSVPRYQLSPNENAKLGGVSYV